MIAQQPTPDQLDYVAPLGRLECYTGRRLPDGWVLCLGQTLHQPRHDFDADEVFVPDLTETPFYDLIDGEEYTPVLPWYDPEMGCGRRWIMKVREPA